MLSFSLAVAANKALYFASSLDALKFEVSWAWSTQIGAAGWHDWESWYKIGTAESHGDKSRAAGSRGIGSHDFKLKVVMKTRHAPSSWWLG
ncbi:hypothetical protein DVH24_031273 [Malus domestica]|uniref:Uncharacterized protein n=1 Tax=Malus domestica TaxID=3750 RepID=A0A498HDT6_MALDO|nr:hypothetical protein DVH24_031273 [Malus domestica]